MRLWIRGSDSLISHLLSGPAHGTCREGEEHTEKSQKAILCKEVLHPPRAVLHTAVPSPDHQR